MKLTITELRKQKGMTMTELAKKANISLPELSDLEKGKRKPRASTTFALAKALGVKFEEIER